MAQSISNESVCMRDSESVAVSVTEDYYDVNLLAAGRFAVSCVVAPGFVMVHAVDRAEQGKDLRGIIFDREVLREFKQGSEPAALIGVLFGGAVGVVAAACSGNLMLLPACAIGGAIVLPYALLNGFGFLYTAVEGTPMAFRAAAKRISHSRPVRALTNGAPAASLRGAVTKPIFRLRKPGLK